MRVVPNPTRYSKALPPRPLHAPLRLLSGQTTSPAAAAAKAARRHREGGGDGDGDGNQFALKEPLQSDITSLGAAQKTQ